MGRLKADFGVTAWVLTIVLLGSFILLGIGTATGQIEWQYLLPLVGAWVGGALSAIGVLKGQKQGSNKALDEATKIIKQLNEELTKYTNREK